VSRAEHGWQGAFLAQRDCGCTGQRLVQFGGRLWLREPRGALDHDVQYQRSEPGAEHFPPGTNVMLGQPDEGLLPDRSAGDPGRCVQPIDDAKKTASQNSPLRRPAIHISGQSRGRTPRSRFWPQLPSAAKAARPGGLHRPERWPAWHPPGPAGRARPDNGQEPVENGMPAQPSNHPPSAPAPGRSQAASRPSASAGPAASACRVASADTWGVSFFVNRKLHLRTHALVTS
jgi:hypothetical protein